LPPESRRLRCVGTIELGYKSNRTHPEDLPSQILFVSRDQSFFSGPQLSFCNATSCADCCGSGPDAGAIAVSNINVVIDALMTTPIVAIIKIASITLPLRLRTAKVA
jgi:hypothetical protein